MNETPENQIPSSPEPVSSGAPDAAQNVPRPAAPPFSRREWLMLAAALVLAVLWFRGMSPAGAGLPLFTLCVFGASFAFLGKNVRLTADALFLTAAALLTALSYAVWADGTVMALNFPLLLTVTSMALLALSGRAERTWREAGGLWDGVRLGVASLFVHFSKPFTAVARLFRGKKKNLFGILIGVLIAVPLLAAVISLLAAADEVFGGLFRELSAFLKRTDAAQEAWRVVRTVLLGAMFFSALFALGVPVKKRAGAGKAAPAPLPSAPVLTVLALLDAVYAVFVAIQFAFLFGGAETASMHGGYAEYARSGFFQLAAVAVINLCAALLAASLGSGRAVRILSLLLEGFTVVILASALKRMCLYISVYGMSLERAMTLWGMAFTAVCIAAAAVKTLKPSFRFWPVFFAVGVSLWLVFSFIGIDGRIADWNVDAYLSGSVQSVDLDYLSTLSPDALPALRRLQAKTGTNFKGSWDPDLCPAYPTCLDDVIADKEARRARDVSSWRTWRLAAALDAPGK